MHVYSTSINIFKKSPNNQRMMFFTTLDAEEREKEMLKLLPAVIGLTATIEQLRKGLEHGETALDMLIQKQHQAEANG